MGWTCRAFIDISVDRLATTKPNWVVVVWLDLRKNLLKGQPRTAYVKRFIDAAIYTI